MDEHRTRTRSPREPLHRSPRSESHIHSHTHQHSHSNRHHRSRSRSPGRRHRSHRHGSQHVEDTQRALPLGATTISKHDLATYRPLFGMYLDVTKELDIDDLADGEVKGRWKSFVKKWNNGDLREGWYDVETFERAKRGTSDLRAGGHEDEPVAGARHGNNAYGRDRRDGEGEGEDDEFGPQLPTTSPDVARRGFNARAGPSIPSTLDLRARREQAMEDEVADRERYTRDFRAERKADRKLQDARLDELAPRSEAGSRERQIEKKREVADSNRAFAAAKDTGGDAELRDADVMGEADSLGELKRMKQIEERKKTDREMRKDEMMRARQAEREERVKGMREKEAKTMELLKSIAKARFGGGDK